MTEQEPSIGQAPTAEMPIVPSNGEMSLPSTNIPNWPNFELCGYDDFAFSNIAMLDPSFDMTHLKEDLEEEE